MLIANKAIYVIENIAQQQSNKISKYSKTSLFTQLGIFIFRDQYLYNDLSSCNCKRENSPISPELSSSNSMNCSANDGEENEKKLNKTTDKITHIGSLNKGVLFHDNHLFHLHKFNYAKCIASTHINNITRPDKTYFCTIPDAH